MPKKRISPALCRASIAPLALLLLQALALAAEAPVTPGSVQDTIGTGKARLPSTPPQVVLPVQPAPSPHDPRARRFRVNAFDMSGNTVYKTRTLKTLLERFVDLELNLHDLNKAADTITAFYHDHGYTLARAVIPAQKVENGVVRIRIIEGRFGQVTFAGNKRYSSAFLAARTGLLTPGALVTTDRLENNLLLLNDLPGVSAKAVLEPGAEFGATDAEIQVKEKLIDGSVNLSNYGRSETGQNKVDVGLNINAPFGWGDQLNLSGSSTQQKLVRYWKVGYSLPLNTAGTRIAIASAKTAYDVSGAVAALGISGEIRTEELAISHPFVRSRDDNQSLIVGVKRSRLVQTALGTEISDNRISVLTTSYQISRIHDDTSVTNASFGLATNFKSGNSATKQDAVFARMEADVNHTAPFMGRWDIYLRGNLVHSKEMLPDTEKFSLGGPNSVRAFRPSEVRGDRGYLATMELRRPFAVANSVGVFRLTADAGEVVYKMPGFSDSRDRLRSVGLGATIYPMKGITASIDAATPAGTTHTASDGSRNHRIWVNVSASF
ncbi:MAG: polypeptide-transport-associated domain protein ShlB-type [Herminiimonas sp.]|nr:polypeptide-transport-associated domain protein ShlB-type [Herminiimonas sp.]